MIEIPVPWGESFPGLLYFGELKTGKVLYSNSAFSHLFPHFGSEPNQGWERVWSSIPELESQVWKTKRNDLHSSKSGMAEEFEFNFKGLAFRGKEVTSQNENDDKTLFYGTFLEITQEKEYKQELEKYKLDKKDCLDLASKLTHNLNNSLQPILIFANLGKELLIKKEEENQAKEYFEKIIHSGQLAREQLHAYVANLTNLSPSFKKEEKPNSDILSPKNKWDLVRTKKIWIVEDDPLTLEAISEMLVIQNIQATLYSSPMDALFGLSKEIPDLIVTDWHMNELNGLDLLRRIHQRKNSVSAILFSGRILEEEPPKIEGMDILLRQKPIPVPEFYESVLLALGYL